MPLLLPRQNAPPTAAPPGVVIDYANPVSIGDRVVVSNVILGALALLFVLLRVLIKWRVSRAWGWEDFFIVIALLFLIGRVVIEVLNVKLWLLGLHVWDIRPEKLLAIGNYQHNGVFIGDMLYFWGIMFTKLSILTLYVKIFKINKVFRYICYGMMAFTIVYLMIFFFLFAFNCNPPARTWHLLGWTGGGSCFDNIKTSYAVGGINIFTDIVILIMPLPLIYRLQLKLAQKLGLIAIFGTGILVVVCTIARQVIIVETLRDYDQTWAPVPEIIWLTAELSVGIICACLPALAPIYSRKMISNLVPASLRNLLQSLRSRTGSGTSSTPKNSTPESAKISKSDSNIELVDRNQVGGYTNIDKANKGYIQQTRAFDVKYVSNEESIQKPGASFQV
ncbi:Btp1 [Botrytis cinerea B05.10]|uniref:Btp1 n=2 Tax=Botryotinia fuckeliana TaxID=40559 RepID=A0A384J5L5_BOTFB|nr:Btp1 [Botrytis cinerea B05.10]ATZ45769.1 Btp1 [Botrytis cinerea B05.10]CAE55153.1 putative G protein-coupled receptor alpha [Botrytis cinerea]